MGGIDTGDIAKATRRLTMQETIQSLQNQIIEERQKHERTRSALMSFLHLYAESVENGPLLGKIIAELEGAQLEQKRDY